MKGKYLGLNIMAIQLAGKEKKKRSPFEHSLEFENSTHLEQIVIKYGGYLKTYNACCRTRLDN